MTPRRKANHIPAHGCCSLLAARWQREKHATTYVNFPTQIFHTSVALRCDGNSQGFAPASRTGFSRENRARGEMRLTSKLVLLRMSGGVPCTEHCRSAESAREKQSEQTFGPTNNCSVPFFPMSRERFGRARQRRTSPLLRAAPNAPQNFISQVSAIGQAMRSPRSSAKSSSVTACGTSRSKPGDHRHPSLSSIARVRQTIATAVHPIKFSTSLFMFPPSNRAG